ncbi:ABC transporter substrate-binding protein [Oligoflexus sp.]|uniref:ABC transporter substrate-binding protein n=1 Tax=Oligoflexus sp. TaxID=1971216 RepID=UPI002D7E3B0F|nr:ABC transporter substrate-binding protein [Oligoflexus sp.]
MEAAPRTRIHVGLDNSIRSFDPRQMVDANFRSMADLIHCRLMNVDAEGHAVPGIAAQEPVWTSPQVLEVKLKDDVKFSDGSPLTAADVVATYKSLLTHASFAEAASFHALSDVHAQAQTIVFTLKEADAGFISKLALGILPAKLAGQASIDFLNAPVCGPYFISRRDGERIILEKNPHETFSGPSAFTHIEFHIAPNEKARFAMLQKGDIDLLQNSIPAAALKDLAKNPQLTVMKGPGLRTRSIAFNFRDPLAGNAAVREAIALALDRKPIIDLVLGGLATPVSPRPYDPGKAEKILDEAGFKRKRGVRMELSFKTNADVDQIRIAKAMAAQLKKIGIRLVIEPMESKSLDEDAAAGRLQLWSLDWTSANDADVLREAFFSLNTPPRGMNRGWYNNPKLDALLEKGKISRSPEQRRAVYQDVQELLDKDLPYIVLWHDDQVAVMNRELKGYALAADGRYTALRRASFSD